ncbi:MAG: serine protease, partial [Anaerolineae bacterium]|nr:serine protease [Anaerolineae bacterium]
MPFSSMNMGIQAVQAGHLEEGARLLRIALRSDKLSGSLRATTLVYLAQTSPDRDFKIKCYNDALVSDPAHEVAHQKLAELYNADLMRMSPPPPVSNIPEPPVALTDSRQNIPAQYPPSRGGTGPLPSSPSAGNPAGTYRFAGIIGGPNGIGSAFFVDRDGLLATSRFAVGGIEEVMVELETGRQTLGKVVRAYPELDLAFVQVEQTVTDLMPISVLPRVPEDMPIMTISFDGTTLRGKRRATRKVIPAHWFPTDIPNADIRDAGGAPIL